MVELLYVNIKAMYLAPSGYVYMLGKKDSVWFVRVLDGVEMGKIPFILADRFEKINNKDWDTPDIDVDREVAYDRLMHFGVGLDDSGCWEIAGIDISSDNSYMKAKLVFSSYKAKEAKKMFNFIACMAKMSGRFGSGELRMHFLADGEMDRDKSPHLHYKERKDSLAAISLDTCEVLAGSLPVNFSKDIMRCIQDNKLYYKFCWDFLTQQKVFCGEYAGKEEAFLARLYKDNPNIRDRYRG